MKLHKDTIKNVPVNGGKAGCSTALVSAFHNIVECPSVFVLPPRNLSTMHKGLKGWAAYQDRINESNRFLSDSDASVIDKGEDATNNRGRRGGTKNFSILSAQGNSVPCPIVDAIEFKRCHVKRFKNISLTHLPRYQDSLW